MPEQPSPPSAGPDAAGQAQQAPMGVSPVTGPTPNRGLEAAGVQKVGMAIKLLTDALPLVGATSEIGQEIMKAITKFSKIVPAGTVTPASERNNIQQMAMRNAQNSQDLASMRSMGGGQGGGGQQQQMPGA